MKTIFFRFSIALTAFFLGLGFFGGFYWLQTKSKTPKLETAQTIINKEPIVIPSSQASSEIEHSDETKPNFEDGGYYYIVGKQPKPFADINEFQIEFLVYDEKKDETISIPRKGYLSEVGKIYDFKKVYLGNQHITFETESINGISFQFKGKLVDKIYKFEDDLIDLEGKLSKWNGNKKVAEANFKFAMTLGC